MQLISSLSKRKTESCDQSKITDPLTSGLNGTAMCLPSFPLLSIGWWDALYSPNSTFAGDTTTSRLSQGMNGKPHSLLQKAYLNQPLCSLALPTPLPHFK